MRILHVVNTLDLAGAGPVEAARLYGAASDAENEVEVLSLDVDAGRWSKPWPVPVHGVKRSLSMYRYSPDFVPWLKAHVSGFDAAVVHGVYHYHLPGVWRALAAGPTPYFVILHGMLNPWFKRTYPLKHIKKVLFWHALIKRSIEGAAAVLFLCEEERRLALQTFFFEPRDFAYVPLGTQAFRGSAELFFSRFPELRGRRLLLFLGRICYMKGCDLLLEAFAETARDQPDAHLVMCGPDHEGLQQRLLQLCERLGLQDRVTWPGPLYEDMKGSAMKAAELFLLPSRCETFPIAVLEALSSSLPVVVTDQVNIHPAIRGARAGFVSEASKESVAEELRNWFSLTVGERYDFKSRAQKCFVEHFELTAAVRKHLHVIRQHLPIKDAVAKASSRHGCLSISRSSRG